MLIHQKSHTGRAFDNYSRLNELADITAKEKAIAELSKLFPRKPPNEEESANENTQSYMNLISQSDADPPTYSGSNDSKNVQKFVR